MELYVLNENLERIAIVDDYTSLIWAKRYNDIGDCEIYIEATSYNIALFQRNYFVERSDDDMICRIKKIELTTDVERGNYLIVTGYDCKDILNQRIVWNQTIYRGKVESYIIKIIRDAFNMDATSTTQRQIKFLDIVTRTRNINDEIDDKAIHDNVGVKISSLCKTYGYGYKIFRENKKLMFDIYKGEDRTNRVIFSNEYDNLLSSNYIEDSTNIGNVALIGGRTIGNKQQEATLQHVPGINRYEIYVDASNMSDTTTFAELKTMYPTGQIEKETNTRIYYKVNEIYVLLLDNIQFDNLKLVYTNGIACYQDQDDQYITIDKTKTLEELQELYPEKTLLYKILQVRVANLITATVDQQGTVIPPKDEDTVLIADILYGAYLLSKGYDSIKQHGVKTSFNASIEHAQSFEYNKDYKLGDLVLVENEYGMKAKTRLVETIETFDENGYSIEPKFEFMEVK